MAAYKNFGRGGAAVVGSNRKMNEFQAVLLAHQLERLPGQNQEREAQVQKVRALCAGFSNVDMMEDDPDLHNPSRYFVVLRVRPEVARECSQRVREIVSHRSCEKTIALRIMWGR